MGPERKSAVLREEERRNTAYHESGHAVVAKLLPKADPVHKVTIMPRGYALGLTWQLPEHDRVNMYKDKMLEEIAILFGGRIAEEIFMHQMSTGASNDFERATKLARAMVTRYGMSRPSEPWFTRMRNRTITLVACLPKRYPRQRRMPCMTRGVRMTSKQIAMSGSTPATPMTAF